MDDYYVWISETEDGKTIEVGHGPYSLQKAKGFGRIGSQYGGLRTLTRGRDGLEIRKYYQGKRVFPTVNKQTAGFQADEVPQSFDNRSQGENPMPSYLWIAAGVGASVAAIVAMIRGGRSAPAPQQGPVRIIGGIATGPTGHTVVLSQETKLLLAQALLGEVGEAASIWDREEKQRGGAAVLWALIQLHMLWQDSNGGVPHRAYPTFERLIRGYVQPLNPRWSDPNAGKCLEYPDACTDRHIARRRRIQGYTWNRIPVKVREIVNSWSAGHIDNPIPGMVDYAAYDYSGAQTTIAGNVFGSKPTRSLVV